MVYSDKWNWRFKEIINKHPIMWKPDDKFSRSRYIVPREMNDVMKVFKIGSKEYIETINPMFNYLNGYSKSVSGYKNYTETDLKNCLKLMDKFLWLYKKLLIKQKLSAIEGDF